MANKTAIYRTVVAMLRENGMSPTDFVVEHLKTMEAKVTVAEGKIVKLSKDLEDRAFGIEPGVTEHE